jgi:hypothetical protein
VGAHVPQFAAAAPRPAVEGKGTIALWRWCSLTSYEKTCEHEAESADDKAQVAKATSDAVSDCIRFNLSAQNSPGRLGTSFR